jgi:hypothetical protein
VTLIGYGGRLRDTLALAWLGGVDLWAPTVSVAICREEATRVSPMAGSPIDVDFGDDVVLNSSR